MLLTAKRDQFVLLRVGTLLSAEKNYPQVEREALIIVFWIEAFSQLFVGYSQIPCCHRSQAIAWFVFC